MSICYDGKENFDFEGNGIQNLNLRLKIQMKYTFIKFFLNFLLN